jgi:hypothetical protein
VILISERHRTVAQSSRPVRVGWHAHRWLGDDRPATRSCLRAPWGLRGGTGQGGEKWFSPKRRVNDVGGGGSVTPGFKAKPDAHRMYAQDQVVIHTVRM